MSPKTMFDWLCVWITSLNRSSSDGSGIQSFWFWRGILCCQLDISVKELQGIPGRFFSENDFWCVTQKRGDEETPTFRLLTLQSYEHFCCRRRVSPSHNSSSSRWIWVRSFTLEAEVGNAQRVKKSKSVSEFWTCFRKNMVFYLVACT